MSKIRRIYDRLRKKASTREKERAVWESEQRFRAFFELSPIGVGMAEPETGRLINANQRLCEITGYGKEELIGKEVEELTHPDDRAADWNKFQRMIRGEFPEYTNVKRYVRKDGHVIWVQVAARAIRDVNGKPVGTLGVIQDITQAKKAQDALGRSEAVLNQAGGMAHVGAWHLEIHNQENLNSNPLCWCDEVYRIFGYEPRKVYVTNELFFERVHPDDRQRVEEALQQAVKERRPYSIEHRIIRPNGEERTVLEHAHINLDRLGRPIQVVGAVQDVTEMREAEKQLEKAKRRLEEADAVKDRFLATLSHELRTPLTPVLAATQLLQRRDDLAPHAKELLETIRRNIGLEARLIDDLLDLTRVMHGKIQLFLQELDVHDVIEAAVAVCRPRLEEKSLELQMELLAKRSTATADPARLQQVFWNIVMNAVKFTPRHGTIQVKSHDKEDGQIEIVVKDTGIGIEQAVLNRIFNPFEQGQRGSFGGVGLGLSISKSLVEMHQGSIRAESAGIGKGSTFTIALPALSSMTRIEPPAKGDSGQTKRERSKKILLVEDHADTASLLKESLQSRGHRVVHAESVASALWAAHRERFDLLLCDLGLPDGSGIDVLKKLDGDRPPKAAAITGYGQVEDVERSKEAGFNEHLTKPIDLEALDRLVSNEATSNEAQH